MPDVLEKTRRGYVVCAGKRRSHAFPQKAIALGVAQVERYHGDPVRVDMVEVVGDEVVRTLETVATFSPKVAAAPKPRAKAPRAKRPAGLPAALARAIDTAEARAEEAGVRLRKGAAAAAIAAAEKRIGVGLPDDYRAWIACYDGLVDGDVDAVDDEELLPLREVVAEWTFWKKLRDGGKLAAKAKPGKGVRAEWMHPAWVPFTHDGGGDHLCLDLDPASGGRAGQVIRVRHDHPARRVVATSFTAWLAKARWTSDTDA